jgi:hypothetical protein
MESKGLKFMAFGFRIYDLGKKGKKKKTDGSKKIIMKNLVFIWMRNHRIRGHHQETRTLTERFLERRARIGELGDSSICICFLTFSFSFIYISIYIYTHYKA